MGDLGGDRGTRAEMGVGVDWGIRTQAGILDAEGMGGWVQIQELGRGLGNKEREFGRRAGESGR